MTCRFLESLTLGSLVAPVPEEEFRSRYWEQQPLIVHRKNRDYYDDLFTLQDFDEATLRSADYVKMANALPRVVLAPIFTLWFGLGIWSKVALGITLVFFIVFFNVYQGIKEVSLTVLANARMLGMNERQLMRHVYWPSALSWMFSSLHTSVGFAVVGAVVGEYLGAAAGLGYLIQQAEGVFDVAGVFAGMFVLAAFVVVIDVIVTLIERRLLIWRPAPSEAKP